MGPGGRTWYTRMASRRPPHSNSMRTVAAGTRTEPGLLVQGERLDREPDHGGAQ